MARRSRRIEIDPALRAALGIGLGGVVAGVGFAALLPAAFALPVAALCLGLGGLGSMASLDRVRSQRTEALARSLGEFNVRLAATRVKLDGLQSRMDSEPIREADIAPTRASLAELTAEVGLLGGVLRDVATTVADHETRIGEIDAARQAAEKAANATARERAAPEPAAPARKPQAFVELRAETAPQVDAEMKLKEQERAAAILSAFHGAGVELHLQPIVALPHRKVMGYEALARLILPDGAIVTPAEFLPVIEREGQSANLDAQVLTRALAIASHLNSREGAQFISLNLSTQAWIDLRTLHAVGRILETYRSAALRLVIEMPQRIYRSLDPQRLGVVGAIKASGVRFALDHLADLRLDPATLADRGVAFVKASALLLSETDERASGLDVAVADLGQLLRRVGIELIGERAETDRLVADLIEFDVRLAQGFAISPPRPVRQEVLQPAAMMDAKPADGRPEPQPASAAPPPAAAPERVPFRSVLRRASA